MALPGLNKEPACSSQDSGAQHTGWRGIQDRFSKHDAAMVKDYADDIDTLLVFAGLFSAVLTAFVVETYTLLQPNSSAAMTTNQILAFGFSAQLNHVQLSPSIINSTLSSLLTAPSLTPSTSARWINGLFFVSLVLSLAAALFGILAKQWLREYMQWNSPLGNPRENILVRQIRFEAWEAWNVGATITSIPALLELAMVLFLVGVLILLWTLDDLVAMALTIVVSILLGVVSAFTILPVLFTRCPYKSPTAWTCVAGYHAAMFPVLCIIQICRVMLYKLHCWCYYGDSRPRLLRALVRTVLPKRMLWKMRWMPDKFKWPTHLGTWRIRDIQSCRITWLGPWCKRQDALTLAHNELETVLKEEIEKFPPHDASRCRKEFVEDIAETPLLLRALGWVQTASPDSATDELIDQCMLTVHPAKTMDLEPRLRLHTTAVTASCIAYSLQDNIDSHPESALLPLSINNASCSANTKFRHRFGVGRTTSTLLEPQRSSVVDRTHRIQEPEATPSFDYERVHKFPIFLRFLAATLKCNTTSERWPMKQTQAAFQLLLTLREMQDHVPDIQAILGREYYLEGLRPILCIPAEAPPSQDSVEQRAPGLRFETFKLCCNIAKIDVGEGATLCISEGTTDYEDYIPLLEHYFHDTDFDKCSEDELLIFCFSVSSALSDSSSFLQDAVQDRIIRAVKAKLTRSDLTLQYHSLNNILWTLSHILERAFLAKHSHLSLTDPDKTRELFNLLKVALQDAHSDSECEDPTCTWIHPGCTPDLLQMDPQGQPGVDADPTARALENLDGQSAPLDNTITSTPLTTSSNVLERVTNHLRRAVCLPTLKSCVERESDVEKAETVHSEEAKKINVSAGVESVPLSDSKKVFVERPSTSGGSHQCSQVPHLTPIPSNPTLPHDGSEKTNSQLDLADSAEGSLAVVSWGQSAAEPLTTSHLVSPASIPTPISGSCELFHDPVGTSACTLSICPEPALPDLG